MRHLLVTILFLGSLTALTLRAETFKLDDSHNYIGFKIRHLGFSNVNGQFKKSTGTATFNEKTNQLSDIRATIEAASIDTNEPDRDKHLRSEDFFLVDKYPQINFVGTKVNYKGNIPESIEGKLTIRGVTENIILSIKEWGGIAEDAWGNRRFAFEATTVIDRRKFGLTWNKGLKKAAGLTVGNEVTLVLDIQAIKSENK